MRLIIDVYTKISFENCECDVLMETFDMTLLTFSFSGFMKIISGIQSIIFFLLHTFFILPCIWFLIMCVGFLMICVGFLMHFHNEIMLTIMVMYPLISFGMTFILLLYCFENFPSAFADSTMKLIPTLWPLYIFCIHFFPDLFWFIIGLFPLAWLTLIISPIFTVIFIPFILMFTIETFILSGLTSTALILWIFCLNPYTKNFWTQRSILYVSIGAIMWGMATIVIATDLGKFNMYF